MEVFYLKSPDKINNIPPKGLLFCNNFYNVQFIHSKLFFSNISVSSHRIIFICCRSEASCELQSIEQYFTLLELITIILTN